MGWICQRCGLENAFERHACIACRSIPDVLHLRREARQDAGRQRRFARLTRTCRRDFCRLLSAARLLCLLVLFAAAIFAVRSFAVTEGYSTENTLQALSDGLPELPWPDIRPFRRAARGLEARLLTMPELPDLTSAAAPACPTPLEALAQNASALRMRWQRLLQRLSATTR